MVFLPSVAYAAPHPMTSATLNTIKLCIEFRITHPSIQIAL